MAKEKSPPAPPTSPQESLPLGARSTGPAPASFEAALTELEGLVQGLESGKLSLEGALTGYQRGTELIRYCQQTLDHAEQKIQVLEAGSLQDFKSADNAGAARPEAEPF